MEFFTTNQKLWDNIRVLYNRITVYYIVFFFAACWQKIAKLFFAKRHQLLNMACCTGAVIAEPIYFNFNEGALIPALASPYYTNMGHMANIL
jgi:hypothetical protein